MPVSAFLHALRAFQSGHLGYDDLSTEIERQLVIERTPSAALLETLRDHQAAQPLPDDRHEAISKQIAEWPQDPTVVTGGSRQPSAERATGVGVGDARLRRPVSQEFTAAVRQCDVPQSLRTRLSQQQHRLSRGAGNGQVNLAGWAMLALVAVVAAARAASTPVSQEFTAAETRLDAAVSRCTEFSELVSCAAALGMKPNDPRLLVAEGDALVQLRRPGEAIGVYRNAIKSGAVQDSVDPKIAVAQAHRRSLLHECETEAGAAAERACESAWLPGAPDEVMVFKRRGLLLQNDNQPGASLDAYLAAARLAPRDRDVARAVVALSGSTGRSDAPTLTARGAALMTLGRPADAILSLREALRLAPDYAGAKVRLRIAEGAVAARRRSPATVATLPATSRESAPRDDGAFSNEAPVTRSN